MKMFIVRKRIRASSVVDAVAKDKSTPPDEVFLETPQSGVSDLPAAIGFSMHTHSDDEDE